MLLKNLIHYHDAERGLTESEEVASLAKNLGPKDPVETEGALNANKRSVAERRKHSCGSFR